MTGLTNGEIWTLARMSEISYTNNLDVNYASEFSQIGYN
jgi:hypothetical protein